MMTSGGRHKIYTMESTITSENVVDVVRVAYNDHLLNQAEITRLYKYYKGEQPVWNRKKVVRPEIVNYVMENHAYAVVAFFSGYGFSDPIQYTRRGEVTSEDKVGANARETSVNIMSLNEFMFSENKGAMDKALADWMLITGVGYRGILPDKRAGVTEDDSPFELATLDPRDTFVVRSRLFGERPVMAVQVIRQSENNQLRWVVWTPDRYYEIEDREIIKESPHVLGGIPIIEYILNEDRMGIFEPVVSLMNALNVIQSSRVDGVEQFVQSFMKFINVDIDAEGFNELKELGAIMAKADPGQTVDIDIVTSELNQDQTQTLVDDMRKQIMSLCGVPDRGGSMTSRGDTGQAVMLRDGWSEAETKMKGFQTMFEPSEREFLKIALKIMSDTRNIKLRLSDIDIKFTRNRTDNLLVKAQGLQNMLEAGIHPQTAITNCGLFSDPEQVYLDSLPFLEKWKSHQAGKKDEGRVGAKSDVEAEDVNIKYKNSELNQDLSE